MSVTHPRLCCTDMALVLGIAGSSHIAGFSVALAAVSTRNLTTKPCVYLVEKTSTSTWGQ